MIMNLNPETFRDYGRTLLSGSHPSANSHSVSLFPQQTVLYQTVSPTWLGCESGMTILSLSLNNQDFQDFYLDKPVELSPGVFVALTAFRGNSSVQLSASFLPRTLQTTVNRAGFLVQPALRVESLYTFFYQEKEQGFLFPGESHPMPELVYADRSSFHSVADGQDLLLQPGEMVLYAPDQWHMQYADPGVAPRFVTVSFEVKNLDYSQLCNRKLQAPQSAVSLLQQMLQEKDHPDPYSQDMILTLLSQLLLTLLREAHASPSQVKAAATLNGENQIIRRAQQYVADHVYEKLTVPVLARSCQVSPSYLTSLFQKHLKISPGEYIRRIKLQHSKQLIREGNRNITQIAQLLQYSTIYHFSRQFKEKFGMTPSEYAKSVKE